MPSGFVEERIVEGRGQRFRVLWTPPATNAAGTVIFQHGIGSSAMTFALLADQIKHMNPEMGLLAFDARHHGHTQSINASEPLDLDLESLVQDFAFVATSMLSSEGPVLLVGHSMGGTVVSSVAFRKMVPNIRGLVVLDAVEGYARESLRGMHRLLSIWPSEFSSPAEAVKWHVTRGHQLQNLASAELSVPPLLQKDPNGKWIWRLDLSQTDQFWDSWFDGLDQMFLSAPAARLLVLAGSGRLDKALTVGQMQGKYQLALFNGAGHYLHEDEPERMGQLIADFWERNTRPLLITPKFGQFRSN